MTESALIREYKKDSTEQILTSGTHVNNMSARIYQTEKGIYIGAICDCGNLEVIAEMSEKEVKEAESDMNDEYWASYESWRVLHDAISRAAGIDISEDYED